MTTKIRQFIPESNTSWSLIMLGAVSLGVQLALIRQFLNVFAGNELVIGMLMAVWMVLTAVGAGAPLIRRWFTGSRTSLAWGFFWLEAFALIGLLVLYAARVFLFPQGSMPDFWSTFLVALLSMGPFCLVSGSLFVSLVSVGQQDPIAISSAYRFESVGSFIGVLLINTLLMFVLKKTDTIFASAALSLAWGVYLSVKSGGRAFNKVLIPVLGMLIFAAGLAFSEHYTVGLFYRGQGVIFHEQGPYGQVVVTKTGGQYNFYENGSPIQVIDDPVEKEESVHYAMLQRKEPKNVLMISGSVSGQVREVLIYNPARVDVMEINPLVLKAGRQCGLLEDDPRVHYIEGDARYLVTRKKQDIRYDVVLVLLPEPTTAQINRYYTLDFFKGLKKKLTENAVVSVALRSTADYANPVSTKINSTVYYTLKREFRRVLLIPGQRNYLLASGSPLFIRIAEKSIERNIQTEYVNPYYLDDELLKKRTEDNMKRLDASVSINRDFNPSAYFLQIRLWMLQMNTRTLAPLILLAALLLFYLLRCKRPELSLFLTAFTTAAMEFLLIYAWQAFFGQIFLMLGFLVGLFMLGLAVGTWLYERLQEDESLPSVPVIQVIVGIYAIVTLIFLLGIRDLTTNIYLLSMLFGLMMLLGGAVTGLQFSIMSAKISESPGSVAGRLYSADLAGAALGTILISALIFPLFGIIGICVVLGLVNAGLGFVLF